MDLSEQIPPITSDDPDWNAYLEVASENYRFLRTNTVGDTTGERLANLAIEVREVLIVEAVGDFLIRLGGHEDPQRGEKTLRNRAALRTKLGLGTGRLRSIKETARTFGITDTTTKELLKRESWSVGEKVRKIRNARLDRNKK